MAKYTLIVNGKQHTFDVVETMPLLWALRDIMGLTGTKYGCGFGVCGACTVLVDGTAEKSCQLPVSHFVGKKITTIEGLTTDASHPVQKAWMEEDVPQCGYCQGGQILAAVALLKNTKNPSDEDIDTAMQGNICRCGTYERVRKAIHRAAKEVQPK
jgi:aerobic-type carbon monoxide dehydrogenase small subunit (CoxS/CutS family)